MVWSKNSLPSRTRLNMRARLNVHASNAILLPYQPIFNLIKSSHLVLSLAGLTSWLVILLSSSSSRLVWFSLRRRIVECRGNGEEMWRQVRPLPGFQHVHQAESAGALCTLDGRSPLPATIARQHRMFLLPSRPAYPAITWVYRMNAFRYRS